MLQNPQIPTSSKQLLQTLKSLKIAYKLYNHAPVFHVSEGLHLKAEIPGTHCRNLFLKDKKGCLALITAANETLIDLKMLPEKLNCGRLSFASEERLMQYLGIYAGAVTPFAAINDQTHSVQIILDETMMKADVINVHPLDNAMTIGLSPADLLNFFNHTGHKPQILAF